MHEYVLIAQCQRRIETYRREGDRRWQLDEYGVGDKLQFDSLSIELAVDDLYIDRVGTIVQ